MRCVYRHIKDFMEHRKIVCCAVSSNKKFHGDSLREFLYGVQYGTVRYGMYSMYSMYRLCTVCTEYVQYVQYVQHVQYVLCIFYQVLIPKYAKYNENIFSHSPIFPKTASF